VPEIIRNNTINLLIKISWKQPKSSLLFKSAVSSLEPNGFRVLFEKKTASVYFVSKMCLYFSIGNGQPREPALCQLYRHSFVPYEFAFLKKNLL